MAASRCPNASSSSSAPAARAASMKRSRWLLAFRKGAFAMSISQTEPSYEYIAYIDESGDPGLGKVKGVTDEKGSSEWLIVAATVVRRRDEAHMEPWVKGITSQFRGHQKTGIHFKDLSAAKRLVVCSEMVRLPLRCFVVASNKKNMQGHQNPWAELIPSDNWFYCWMTRLLLERVTRFVDIHAREQFGKPATLKIVFSRRGRMSYPQLEAYYTWLKIKSVADAQFLDIGDISWSVMDRRQIFVCDHEEDFGLHFADATASAFFKACDYRDTGSCDPQFAQKLELIMGRYPNILDGQIAGYGLKLMPGLRKARLRQDQQRIFRWYGYPHQWWDPNRTTP